MEVAGLQLIGMGFMEKLLQFRYPVPPTCDPYAKVASSMTEVRFNLHGWYKVGTRLRPGKEAMPGGGAVRLYPPEEPEESTYMYRLNDRAFRRQYNQTLTTYPWSEYVMA